MKQNNPATLETTITKLSHDGRGIAQIKGKTTFIENALPGETVTFQLTRRHNKYDEGKAVEIIQPSPDRVEPKCRHFMVCGGCALQHMSHERQRQLKQEGLLEQLQHFGGVQPQTVLPPLIGNAWGYRRKARLGVKYVAKKQTVLVGFREKNGRYLAELNRCEVLHPSVGAIIEDLKSLISQLDAYQTLPQIEVAVSDESTALVFRHMEPLSETDQNKLIAFAQQKNIIVYLQPGKPETVHLLWPPQADPLLYYQLPEHTLTLAFHPTDFTQINTDINRQMVTRAVELLALKPTDRVLDLFCGLGNFTLALARHCAAVIGVEGATEMVRRAEKNAEINKLTNVQFYAADLAAETIHAPWMQLAFDKILLDPPRSGALAIIKQFPKLHPRRILYISCNPATLARDTAELVNQGYQLLQAGIMDMFPHTHHVETIAVFAK